MKVAYLFETLIEISDEYDVVIQKNSRTQKPFYQTKSIYLSIYQNIWKKRYIKDMGSRTDWEIDRTVKSRNFVCVGHFTHYSKPYNHEINWFLI